VEEAAVGFQEGGEAGAGEAHFLEDHCRGDLLPTGEDLGELGLDFLIGNLGETAAGSLPSRSGLGGLGSLGAFGGEAEAGKQGLHLLQLLGVLLVNCGDFLRNLLLNDGLGLEHLLGGFLLQGGELLDEIEGCFGLGHGGVMGVWDLWSNHFSRMKGSLSKTLRLVLGRGKKEKEG